MLRRTPLPLVVLACLCISATDAQDPSDTSQSSTDPAVKGDCAAVPEGNFEGFIVRTDPVLRHPFEFLPWVHKQLQELRPRLKVVKDKPYDTANERADFNLLQTQFQLPPTDSDGTPFKANVLVAALSDCRDHALSVEYDVLTTQFFTTPTAEAQQQPFERPEQSANVTRPKTFLLRPTAGYNASDSFFAGGNLRKRFFSRTATVNSISFDGAASDTYQSAAGALNGSFEPSSFGALTWDLGYVYRSLPTDKKSLTESRFNGRVIATTRPFGNSGLVFRFGGQIEGGHLQSGFSTADLGPGAISSTAYSSARLFSGFTFGTKHTAFRTSYGLELGSNGGLGADWKRHIGDGSFDFWFPLGDHRPVQIESRFTAGAVQHDAGAPVPVSKLLFGGNEQESFLEGDDWDFRANPVLRSIPARQFNQTSAGVGAERFYAFNLTVAPTAWRKPLLPREITDDAMFKMLLDQQWDLNAALFATNYITKDPAYSSTQMKLPRVKETLASLSMTLEGAGPSVPEAVQPLFDTCAASARLATRRLNSAMTQDPAVSADVKYGFLAALLKEGKEQVLPKAIDACKTKLGPALNNPTLNAASDSLVQAFNDLESAYAKISRDAAIKKASDELIFPNGIFNTIVHDLNVISISPVFVFDTARIWPQATDGQGMRYGVGGGVRVTLVSHANFTLGYARNLNRIPQEGSGAIFFSISITELLR